MPPVEPCDLPAGALLARYARDGNYTDCWTTRVPGKVAFARYVEAFYCTWVFRTERVILAWAVRKPSTDEEARHLARGEGRSFAAWNVEDRADNQLLLGDFMDRTGSWLMAAPEGEGTRLYFGSRVKARRDRRSGEPGLGPGFDLALGFRKLYSRVLLGAAARRLVRN